MTYFLWPLRFSIHKLFINFTYAGRSYPHAMFTVSGHMETGDLVAILGCSGAGKTTLLAAISQRLRGNLTGEIVVNGIVTQRADMIRISSFLPQFEINVQTFTAYEHLYFMVSTWQKKIFVRQKKKKLFKGVLF